MDACQLRNTVPSSGGELLPGLQIYLYTLAGLHGTLRMYNEGWMWLFRLCNERMSACWKGEECKNTIESFEIFRILFLLLLREISTIRTLAASIVHTR